MTKRDKTEGNEIRKTLIASGNLKPGVVNNFLAVSKSALYTRTVDDVYAVRTLKQNTSKKK